jgi:hypothetical protein
MGYVNYPESHKWQVPDPGGKTSINCLNHNSKNSILKQNTTLKRYLMTYV